MNLFRPLISTSFLLTTLAVLSLSSQSKALELKAIDGGVSGGGGYVIDPKSPENYQNPEKIEKMIEYVITPLKKYLLFKNKALLQNTLNDQEKEIFTKLFNPQNHIIKAMDKVKMDIQDDRSCFDRFNRPVDGSIFNKNKQQVCISAANIAEKVHHSEVSAQSAALVVHEYTEILGFEEDDAVKAQLITLNDLKALTLTTPENDCSEEKNNQETDAKKY